MDEKRIKKAKITIIFSTLLFTVAFFMEIYAITNYKDNFILNGIIILIALLMLYILINGIIDILSQKNQEYEEHYDSIFKSEKASYLMTRKNFEDIEERLERVEKVAMVPTEDIVGAQKGIAKVIINRSRENAEALMRSNDLITESLGELEEIIRLNSQKMETLLNSGNEHVEQTVNGLGQTIGEKIQANGQQLAERMASGNQDMLNQEKIVRAENTQQILDRQQELLINLKDMELRLNAAIAQSQKIIASQTPMMAPPMMPQMPVMPEMSATQQQAAVHVPEPAEAPRDVL